MKTNSQGQRCPARSTLRCDEGDAVADLSIIVLMIDEALCDRGRVVVGEDDVLLLIRTLIGRESVREH